MTEIAKKPKSSTEDRISALPDHLLHHIMSSLELKEVMTTSILSTRWKSLWTSVPSLDLGTWEGGTEEIIPTRITFFLLHYNSPKIKKFRAQFDYADLTDYLINSWIIFATQHDVEEFDLNLNSEHVHPGYKVPWRLLHCGSLEVLRLTFCVLKLQSVNLSSLKELHLDDVTVSDLNTSGCPVLESLFLNDCHTDGHINIHSPSQKLRYLTIHDSYDVVSCHHSAVTIFAPNLESIQLTGYFRHFYDVKNLSSLKSASLQVDKLDGDLDTMPLLKLFQRAIQVPKLELSDWCIQVLDNWELIRFSKNWELISDVPLSPFRATCLKLDICFNQLSLRKMSYVLRKAQDLNSLTFDIRASPKQFQETWDCITSLAYTLSTIQKLKTVEIHNFLGSGSSFLSELPKPNLREFVNEWKKEIKLVKYLLGNCTALEKMNISTIKMPMMPRLMKQEYLHAVHAVERRLLAFPRASVNVELCIYLQI